MDARREELETQGAVVLEVRVPAGELEVEAGPPGSTVVELQPLGGDDSRAAVEEARIERRDEGSRSRVIVHVRPQRRLLRGGDAKVRVHARVPEGADLEASTASADVQTRGALGAVRVEVASGDVEVDLAGAGTRVDSASGDVKLRSVDGDASVSTASGDVRVDRLQGTGRIRTASGDVEVGDAHGDLEIQSASGDQRVDAVSEGKVSLRSASGDLSVGVRRGSAVFVDARSMSGETSSEIDLDGVAGEEQGDGAPLVELRAISMSGDVRVLRAPGA
jgi:DUF4097 and DUF4098 domain-containing protein YvlB